MIVNKPEESNYNQESQMETLTGRLAMKLLIVRVNFLETPEPREDNTYNWWAEKGLPAVANRLRASLILGQNPKNGHTHPKLALIFPSTEKWSDDIYLEQGKISIMPAMVT